MAEKMPKFIFAFNGHRLRKFYFAKPTFEIEEMAWSTSMQCRFTGHVKRFYSVAEHCILVSSLVRHLRLGDPFEALMHDMHEGYLNDVSSPVKANLPDYKALENRIEAALRASYRFPREKNPRIKYGDRLALYIEATHLMPEGAVDELVCGDEATKEAARRIACHWTLACHTPERAREDFMFHYEQLRP